MDVKTALISVYNKEGLVEFGFGLAKQGIHIYSTGNTFDRLAGKLGNVVVHDAGGREKLPQLVDAGVKPVPRNGHSKPLRPRSANYTRFLRRVSDITGNVETLNGRLKTLDWRLFEGILDADRGSARKNGNGAPLLDMVVVNFYPFTQVVKRAGVSESKAVENIDIGGPAMVRSAAKNYQHVIVVVDPADYPEVLWRIRTDRNSLVWRKRLALRAWQVVADYDRAIAGFFSRRWAKTKSSLRT